MFPKSKKLDSKEVSQVIQQGKRVNLGSFSVSVLANPGQESRFAVAVPKKTAKFAVTRNRIKRRFFSFIKANEAFLPPNHLFVFFVFDKAFTQTPETLDLLKKISRKI